MVLDPPEGNSHAQPSPLEALLAGQVNFPAMLDIPPDADDETMVELAIALSLQDQVHVVSCTSIWYLVGRWRRSHEKKSSH